MRAVDLIRKKRDGGEHTAGEIAFLLDSFTRGETPDYQMAAWMMALLLRGGSSAETAAITDAMLHSGTTLDLSSLSGAKVDKHSTGGVGDSTSLIIAPVVAAGGLSVPMISGRGLGHTGGTLDKLESIPGFDVNLSSDEMMRVLRTCGFCMVGQTAEIAPVDRKMYALRDVTGTVESRPLICASIMSKKLAEGIDALVLDVKTGSGAFMRRAEDAEELARMMMETGARMGKKVCAFITDMDQPLGRNVGNALEVIECVEILRGVRNPLSEDMRSLSLDLCAWMFYLGRRVANVDEGRQLAEQMITEGHALKHFRSMVQEQRGDARIIDDFTRLPVAKFRTEFTAATNGYIAAIECDLVGLASLALGGGRNRKEDNIDPAVGLELHKKLGNSVTAGDCIATIHYNDPARLPEAIRLLRDAYQIDNQSSLSSPFVPRWQIAGGGPGRGNAPRKLIRKILTP